MSNLSLEAKTAIVTGGATLIGAKVVEALNAAGAKVMSADLNEVDGRAAIETLGDDVQFAHTDITAG